MSILTSRGCPFSCKYCYHIFGNGARVRSIDKVIEEIKKCKKKFKFESLLILDETFTIDRKRVMEFCNKIIKENMNLPWSCYARVNLVDIEMLKIMKKAGCYRIGYGIESGSQKILDRMNKRVTIEQAKKAITETRRTGLECGVTFMFGYPGENHETIKETRDFCKKLRCKPSFFYTAPYPGTVLYQEFRNRIISMFGNEEEYIEQLGDASDFLVNLTDYPDEQLVQLKNGLEKEVNNILFTELPGILWHHYRQFGLRSLVKKAKRRFYIKNIGNG
jgi:radical SAM superfamily enzyme YgiQ (UPF0313 family)